MERSFDSVSLHLKSGAGCSENLMKLGNPPLLAIDRMFGNRETKHVRAILQLKDLLMRSVQLLRAS